MDRGRHKSWSGIARLMVIPMIILSIFALVWLKAEITSLEYRISRYEKERLDLLRRKKELIVKRSELLSIENIEHIAMNRLGLTFPDRKKVIYVKRGGGTFNYRAGFGTGGD